MKVNKINQQFLATYIEVDRACAEKLGVASAGVCEYIRRLTNTRFAPGRDETLTRLLRYRAVRSRIAQDPANFASLSEISKDDVRWLKNFKSLLGDKLDPISIYLKNAGKYVRGRLILRYISFGAVGCIFILFIILLLLALL